MDKVQNENYSVESVKSILRKDFLERDGDFVYQRTSGRLNWEKMLRKDAAFSEVFGIMTSEKDIIKKAYALASQMISAMQSPFKVKVMVSPGEDSYTNSKVVHVSTKVLDDSSMDIPHRVDIFLGTAIHEGCHLLYTDFAGIEKDKLTHSILNILEDERIERLCGEDMPGYINFLRPFKYYFFNKYRKEHEKEFESANDLSRLINSIIALIRYPAALTDKEIEDFGPVLMEIRNILTPYPDTTADALLMAKRIVEIIKKYVKDNPKDPKQDNRDTESASGQGSSSDDTEQQSGSSESGGESQEDGQEDSGEQKSGSGKSDSEEQDDENTDGGCDGDEPVDASPSGKESEGDGKGQQPAPVQFDEMTEDALQQAMDEIAGQIEEMSRLGTNNDVDNNERDMSSSEQCELIKNDPYIAGILYDAISEGLSSSHTVVHKDIPDNAILYNMSKARIARYIPAIRKALMINAMEYQYSIKGAREGRLDGNKLAEAFQGSPVVYERRGEVKANRMAVCIIIDESGSMDSKSKVNMARDAAVLLNEALIGIPNIDLYIYGHTAIACVCELFAYREGQKKTGRYRLGSTLARRGNLDSMAIREACARVRQNTQEDCIVFMINDGAPNESVSLVKEAVQEMEKDRFSIIAVSVEPEHDPSMIYDKHIKLNLDQFAFELGKVIKKMILKKGRGGNDW